MSKEKETIDDSIEPNENIELNGKIITCYIGKKENRKKSSEFALELKNTDYYDVTGIGKVKLGEEEYLVYYPLYGKSIKIISSKGFQYNAEIYFIEDIKNIVSFFKMKNANYLYGEFKEFVPFNNLDYNYSKFLLNKGSNIIKDIVFYDINYTDLETIYNKKKSLKKNDLKKIKVLKEINDNINYYYQKFTTFSLENEKIIFSSERTELVNDIYSFYEGHLLKKEKEKIIGLCGNYASGKSISLILLNFSCNFPSLYLNLKVLKNTFQTEAYSKIFPNEVMNIFIKRNKTFEEYKEYIKKFYEKAYINLDEFIFKIIDDFKEIEGLIFLDQFSYELFNDGKTFLNDIKTLLSNDKTKLKIIIVNSMNDKSMRDIYKSFKLSCFTKEKQELDIKYTFVENLINKSNLPIEKDIEKNLQLFNFLPLYNFLLLKNKNNQDKVVSETRAWIKKKMESFLEKNHQNNYIFQINEIRLNIDEKIDKNFFQNYFDYFTLKYFYINKDNILKSYFPLVNEVWNDIIYENSFSIFDGEIHYTGSTISSLLELNFINQCKKNTLNLKIDSVIELDTLYNMDKITNMNDKNFKGKNILITQKNENAKSFDVGLLNYKDINNPKMIYIQIKKSSTNNKVTKNETYEVFERNKKKFINIFGIIPLSCYLIYITLYRKFFSKNLNELKDKELEIIKSVDELQSFCKNNNIKLYYFEPKKKIFYIKNENEYFISDLNLLDENSKITDDIDISLEYLNKKKLREFENNKKDVDNFNNMLLNNRYNKSFISDLDGQNKCNFKIVFDFIHNYCINGKIKTYLFLMNDIDGLIKYESKNNILILCLSCDNQKDNFKIKSVVIRNNIVDFKNFSKKEITSDNLDVGNYDLLIWIQFSELTLNGKHLIN